MNLGLRGKNTISLNISEKKNKTVYCHPANDLSPVRDDDLKLYKHLNCASRRKKIDQLAIHLLYNSYQFQLTVQMLLGWKHLS